MTSAKPFSLTSENLKRFEKELQAQSRQRKSLQRNVNAERTQGDGRSSGIQSHGSQLSAFKDDLNFNTTQLENKEAQISNRKHSYSLDRPEPEAFRRNPEGQSRNESWQATPNIVKIDYEEGSDRISYKSNSEEEIPDNEKETSDDNSDDDDDDDDDDDSEEESEESEEDSDEDDDEDDDTETIPRRLLGTPVSVRTHYTSSLNASSSSIPTITSAKSKAESTKTTKTAKTERKGSAASNISSAPSYVMNVNQFRLKKMAAKKEKERQKLGRELTESELSFGSRRNHAAVSRKSMRERATTSAQSKGSYVTVRNWSRWSTYSGAGYSISEGSTTNHRFGKLKDNQKNVTPKTPKARPQHRSQMPHLPVIGKNIVSKSHPDLRKASKRHVTLTLNADPSRARPVSRSQMASRMSTRSIIKTPTAPRVKSVPDLNREAVMSFLMMDRGLNKSANRSDNKLKGASQRKQSKKQDTDNDDEPDFTNRPKRVLKRKERPQRNEPALTSASSMRSNARHRNNRASPRNGERSSLSITSALSITSSKSGATGRSGHASSCASSKPSVTPRKPRLKPRRSHAGYQSNQDLSSSRGSLLAPGTPIDLILQRSPSLRSAITEYSSYLSLAASSAKSARPTSRSSLSSTGKY